MKENNINKSGWHENPNPLTFNKKGETVAPRHHEVAQTRSFNEEFGNKTKVSIKPRENVSLHFNISDGEMDRFTDFSLVQFRKDVEVIDITISRDEDNKTVVELPRDKAILFHDYLLSKNPNFGTTDTADLKQLIELQEDSFEKTRLRRLR